jgi:hypothetical protein
MVRDRPQGRQALVLLGVDKLESDGPLLFG